MGYIALYHQTPPLRLLLDSRTALFGSMPNNVNPVPITAIRWLAFIRIQFLQTAALLGHTVPCTPLPGYNYAHIYLGQLTAFLLLRT